MQTSHLPYKVDIIIYSNIWNLSYEWAQSKRGRREYISKGGHDHDKEIHRDSYPDLLGGQAL